MRIDGNDGRFTSRIPKEVRQDPEIVEKLEELDNSTRQYMQFDMNRFQADMNKELEGYISRLNSDFKEHQANVSAKLDKCEQANEQSYKLKDSMVQWRYQK